MKSGIVDRVLYSYRIIKSCGVNREQVSLLLQDQVPERSDVHKARNTGPPCRTTSRSIAFNVEAFDNVLQTLSVTQCTRQYAPN